MSLQNYQRQIANTGIYVSPVGLGTVKLGRDQGVKYPNNFVIPDDKTALELLAMAKDYGINLIDTAPAYGISEQRLGTLLKGQRDDWVICSKVGEEFTNGKSYFDFTPEHTHISILRSLKRLDTDMIDLVLVHSDGNDEDIITHYGILEVLREFKQRGLIKAFGMSTKTVAGGLLAAKQSDCVMVTHNLDYQDEVAVLDYCAANNKGILIKKALGSGHACLNNADPVQNNLDFIYQHPAVSSVIIGTINPSHLIDNAHKALSACKKSIG
jgi:aryl-alcohol dehydrogenase-like predicted oxidoreductase